MQYFGKDFLDGFIDHDPNKALGDQSYTTDIARSHTYTERTKSNDKGYEAGRIAGWATEFALSIAIPVAASEKATLTTSKAISDAAIKKARSEMVESVMSEGLLKFGKNSKGHLIKHADALGYGNKTVNELQKMVPQLEQAAYSLIDRANPALTRVGQWHGHQNALMYISNHGTKMIITESNGTFITVINKSSNNWYKSATPLR